MVQNRTAEVYGSWLAARTPEWRERVRLAALDPFRGYLNALRAHLPHATHVLDGFHVVRLGLQALDEVRRRVQQEQTGHRGHKQDPLYRTRRLLRRRVDRLQPRHFDRLNAALGVGDPHGEVTIAWHAAQALAGALARTDRAAGSRAALDVIATYIDCPVPEVARLARTLHTWQPQLMACFTAEHRTSNGPTEAVNLLIEKVRRVGHGYRKFANYQLRLLLHCGVTWDRVLTPRIRTRRPRMAA